MPSPLCIETLPSTPVNRAIFSCIAQHLPFYSDAEAVPEGEPDEQAEGSADGPYDAPEVVDVVLLLGLHPRRRVHDADRRLVEVHVQLDEGAAELLGRAELLAL